MSFVKSQILNHLANTYSNFLRRDLEKAMDLVFNEIMRTLAEGKSVEIRGFGSYKIRKLKPRKGRNPKDGSKIDIPAKLTVHWKTSKEFFQSLNQETIQNE